MPTGRGRPEEQEKMELEVKILSKLTDKIFSVQVAPTASVYHLKLKENYSAMVA
jgi:hypothetical protein